MAPLPGDPPGAADDYAGGKRWCETMLSRTTDFPWTVIRPPAVLGPADQTLRIAVHRNDVRIFSGLEPSARILSARGHCRNRFDGKNE